MAKNIGLIGDLTPREMDILQLLAESCSNREIAERLVLSPGTVKWYNRQIYNKLVVNSREEAVAVAREKGILATILERKTPHDLPTQITAFVGRKQEQSELVGLLENPEVHLVTVMGSGGIGKTRLALEVGRHFVHTSLAGTFADGIFFVDLAPVNSPDNIITAMADTLNFQFHPDDRSPQQQLSGYLKNKQLLLICDNFEHLLDGAAIVTHILQTARDITLLMTSRERLNLSGETIYKLTGMDYPGKQSIQNPLEYGAVQLFVQAARRVRHDFALETEDLPHIFRICRMVQGMPLGIILAAAWVEILPLSEIDHEITQSIDFLATEQRDLPKRLRSIRAVFDYSWNRMSEVETEFFMKLCVFRGGFTRAAIAGVTGADLHVLIRLANKSLIQQGVDKGRYSIHELLRQYAAQQLQMSGQWDSVQQRHAEFYTQLAERAEPELRLAKQAQWFHILETEHENLRAAMAWSLASGDATLGLRIVVALRDFWFYKGYHVEGKRWCELALEHVADDTPILHGRVLLTLSLVQWGRQQMAEYKQNCEKALYIFREAGNHRYAAWALGQGSWPTKYHSDIDYDSAVERIETAINVLREVDDLPGVAQNLCQLGNVHRVQSNYQQAKVAYETCLEVVSQTGEKNREGILLSNLALIAYAERDYKRAESFAKEAARIAHEIGLKSLLFDSLHTLAGPLAASSRALEAGRLVGAVDAYHDDQGIRFSPDDQHYHDRIRDDVRQQLDAAAFQASWNEGYRMSIDDAVEFGLQVLTILD